MYFCFRSMKTGSNAGSHRIPRWLAKYSGCSVIIWSVGVYSVCGQRIHFIRNSSFGIAHSIRSTAIGSNHSIQSIDTSQIRGSFRSSWYWDNLYGWHFFSINYVYTRKTLSTRCNLQWLGINLFRANENTYNIYIYICNMFTKKKSI